MCGCVCYSKYMLCAKSLQLCLTLCDPVDCSLPGCSRDSPGKNTVPSSRGSSQPRIEPMSPMAPTLHSKYIMPYLQFSIVLNFSPLAVLVVR